MFSLWGSQGGIEKSWTVLQCEAGWREEIKEGTEKGWDEKSEKVQRGLVKERKEHFEIWLGERRAGGKGLHLLHTRSNIKITVRRESLPVSSSILVLFSPENTALT